MKSKKNLLQSVQSLRRAVDQICRLYPKIERSHILHTLVLLKKKPLERLNLALLRAEKKPLHI